MFYLLKVELRVYSFELDGSSVFVADIFFVQTEFEVTAPQELRRNRKEPMKTTPAPTQTSLLKYMGSRRKKEHKRGLEVWAKETKAEIETRLSRRINLQTRPNTSSVADEPEAAQLTHRRRLKHAGSCNYKQAQTIALHLHA